MRNVHPSEFPSKTKGQACVPSVLFVAPQVAAIVSRACSSDQLPHSGKSFADEVIVRRS